MENNNVGLALNVEVLLKFWSNFPQICVTVMSKRRLDVGDVGSVKSSKTSADSSSFSSNIKPGLKMNPYTSKLISRFLYLYALLFADSHCLFSINELFSDQIFYSSIDFLLTVKLEMRYAREKNSILQIYLHFIFIIYYTS